MKRDELATEYGGPWCDCIDHVFAKLTPKKLAAYCEEKGYKQFHSPQRDENGVRYGYFLTSHIEKSSQKGEKDKEVNLVAAFGDFDHLERETRKSVLDAILRIAMFEERTGQKVANDVAKCDEELAPKAKDPPKVEQKEYFAPSVKRFRQTAGGTYPI